MQMAQKNKIIEALQNTLNTNKDIRKKAESCLDFHEDSKDYLIILFEVIKEFDSNPNQLDLIGACYLKNFIQRTYKNIEGTLKFNIQEEVFNLFLSHQNIKIRDELILAINRMVTLDFPQSQIFEQLFQYFTEERLLLLQSKQEAKNFSLFIKVLYSIFKRLNKEKSQVSNFHKTYIINYFSFKLNIVKQIINAIIANVCYLNQELSKVSKEALGELMKNGEFYIPFEEKISFECLKYAIKFFNLENHINSTKDEFDIKLCIEQMEFLQVLVFRLISGLVSSSQFSAESSTSKVLNLICDLRNSIYFYQKMCLNCVLEKKIGSGKAILLVEYLKRHYFSNGDNLFINNNNVVNMNFLEFPENIESLISRTYVDQLIKNETNLIIQALNTCNNIIAVLGFNSMGVLFRAEEPGAVDPDLVLEKYFDENYFELLLNFLLEKVLPLNSNDLSSLKLTPETFYVEIMQKSSDFDLRAAGIELLKVLMLYVNQEKMVKLLDNLIQTFTSQSIEAGTPFIDIIKREAFYNIISGLFKELKNDIEFEEWFNSSLKYELSLENQRFDPLRAQILNLMYHFLDNTYSVSEDLTTQFFDHVTRILENERNNLCLRLLTIKCLIPLFESNSELIVNLQMIMNGLFNLMQSTSESDSKILLLDFVENLVIKMKFHLEPYLASIYEFLDKEWQASEMEDNQMLTIRSKIISILCEILKKIGCDLNFFSLYYNVISKSLFTNDYSEIFLTENGLNLCFLFLQSFNNKQEQVKQMVKNKETQEQISSCFLELASKVRIIFLEKMLMAKICVMIIIEFLNLGIPAITREIGIYLAEGMETHFEEIKEEILARFIDCIEYYLLFFCENSYEIIAKITLFIVNKVCAKAQQQPSASSAQSEELSFVNLGLLKLLSRGLYMNFERGVGLIESLQAKLSGVNGDFFFHFFLETHAHLQKHKPNLEYSRFFIYYTFSLFKINVLLLSNSDNGGSLENSFNAITLNSDLSRRDKIVMLLSACAEELVYIRQYYDKCVYDEEHWIYSNIEDMLVDDENVNLHELKISLSRMTLNTLRADKFKRINYVEELRPLLGPIQGLITEDIKKNLLLLE